MALNLNSLRLFLAVATHGGFSRAARVTGVSQPAISKAVRLLEQQGGAQLLVRAPSGIVLTEAGTLLLDHARALFAEERAAEEQLESLRGLRRGALRVGASTTLAASFLPPILGELYRAHPGIDLRVLSANARTVIGAVLDHQVELGLVEGPVHDGRLEVRPWREDELVVVVGPGHPFARMKRVTGPQLMEEPLVIREEGAGTRDVMLAALRRRRWTARRTFEVNSTEAIKGLVAAGVGWAVLSARIVRDELQLGRLKRLDVPDFALRRMLSWIRWKARRLGPGAAAFRSLAEAYTFP
ncbi:MAG TPA: LysR substrate-binding domain-containing protein [Myxococcaceae bacterium]|nr:LysR substrate-binding domain-containing protein [Myxococcaceae bacterium]